MVRGNTSTQTSKPGKATMLILSAAEKNKGKSELIRVWDSKAHQGAPFINFNPVMQTSQSLDAQHDCIALQPWRLTICGDYIRNLSQQHSTPSEAAAMSGLEAGERTAAYFAGDEQ